MELKSTVERELPCVCLALSDAPFCDCPECGGDGKHWQEIAVFLDYSVTDGEVEIQSSFDAQGNIMELDLHEENQIYREIDKDLEERHEEALLSRAGY